MSLAHALSCNGSENAQCIVTLKNGTHAKPCFAGTAVRAWSEVIDSRNPKSVYRRPAVALSCSRR